MQRVTCDDDLVDVDGNDECYVFFCNGGDDGDCDEVPAPEATIAARHLCMWERMFVAMKITTILIVLLMMMITML